MTRNISNHCIREMKLFVILPFFIHLIHSLSCAHVYYEGTKISFKAYFLTECRSVTDVFHRIVGVDLQSCIIGCKLRSCCMAVSYRRRIRICELFTSISDGELPSTGDCIYVAKSDIADIETSCGICSEGQVCDSNSNECVYKECAERSLTNGVVLGNAFNVGNTVSLKCNRRYSDMSSIKTATCQENGTWTTYANCTQEAIMTCSDIKQCNSAYTDGEYWLYSDVLGGHKVKIFCSGMSTNSPAEYISVNEESNYGFDAKSIYSQSILTKYKKIRLNILNMRIVRSDTSFSVPQDSYLSYGVGRSCNCIGGCLPWKGFFSISLEGTGLKFNKQAEWKAYGWIAGMSHFQRNSENNVISAKCGGFCGRCSPTGHLYAVYNQNDIVADSSAIHPVCA